MNTEVIFFTIAIYNGMRRKNLLPISIDGITSENG